MQKRMGSKSEKRHSSTQRRRSDDYESESYSQSDASGSHELSPKRDSGKHKSRRGHDHSSRSHRRRSRGKEDSNSEYDSDGSDELARTKKRSSRNITEEEIAEYLAKKAQRKV